MHALARRLARDARRAGLLRPCGRILDARSAYLPLQRAQSSAAAAASTTPAEPSAHLQFLLTSRAANMTAETLSRPSGPRTARQKLDVGTPLSPHAEATARMLILHSDTPADALRNPYAFSTHDGGQAGAEATPVVDIEATLRDASPGLAGAFVHPSIHHSVAYMWMDALIDYLTTVALRAREHAAEALDGELHPLAATLASTPLGMRSVGAAALADLDVATARTVFAQVAAIREGAGGHSTERARVIDAVIGVLKTERATAAAAPSRAEMPTLRQLHARICDAVGAGVPVYTPSHSAAALGLSRVVQACKRTAEHVSLAARTAAPDAALVAQVDIPSHEQVLSAAPVCAAALMGITPPPAGVTSMPSLVYGLTVTDARTGDTFTIPTDAEDVQDVYVASVACDPLTYLARINGGSLTAACAPLARVLTPPQFAAMHNLLRACTEDGDGVLAHAYTADGGPTVANAYARVQARMAKEMSAMHNQVVNDMDVCMADMKRLGEAGVQAAERLRAACDFTTAGVRAGAFMGTHAAFSDLAIAMQLTQSRLEGASAALATADDPALHALEKMGISANEALLMRAYADVHPLVSDDPLAPTHGESDYYPSEHTLAPGAEIPTHAESFTLMRAPPLLLQAVAHAARTGSTLTAAMADVTAPAPTVSGAGATDTADSSSTRHSLISVPTKGLAAGLMSADNVAPHYPTLRAQREAEDAAALTRVGTRAGMNMADAHKAAQVALTGADPATEDDNMVFSPGEGYRDASAHTTTHLRVLEATHARDLGAVLALFTAHSRICDERGTPARDFLLYELVADACAAAKRLDVLMSTVLPSLTQQRMVTTPAMAFIILKACALSGDVKRTLNVLDLCEKQGLATHTRFYSAAVSACAHAGDFSTAFATFNRMKRRGVNSDVQMYDTLFRCLGEHGGAYVHELTHYVWSTLYNSPSLRVTPALYTRVIVLFAKQGNVKDMTAARFRMRRAVDGAQTPSRAAFIAMLEAYARAGAYEDARECVREMSHAGMFRGVETVDATSPPLKLDGVTDVGERLQQLFRASSRDLHAHVMATVAAFPDAATAAGAVVDATESEAAAPAVVVRGGSAEASEDDVSDVEVANANAREKARTSLAGLEDAGDAAAAPAAPRVQRRRSAPVAAAAEAATPPVDLDLTPEQEKAQEKK